MPKTAVAPLPTIHAQAARSGRERRGSIEERTAVLETRWEETIPSLATKSDLKADLRGTENRLILWIFGAALALLAVILPMISANTARIDALAARIDEHTSKLEAKFDRRIDKLDARIDKLDARIDKLDTKFDAMMAELRSQRRVQE